MGPRSPCAQQDPAPQRDWPGSAVSLWDGVGCSHPFPSLPAIPVDRLEAPGAGKILAGAFLRVVKTDALLLFGVVLPPCIGLCMFLWKGAEFAVLLSLPCCSMRGHTRTPVSLCVNLCRWRLMFLPCPLQQMADFSVGYLYPRLIFPSVFYFCL